MSRCNYLIFQFLRNNKVVTEPYMTIDESMNQLAHIFNHQDQ